MPKEKLTHTPGPWRIGFDDADHAYITTPAGEVVVSGGKDDWGVTHGVRGEANARLIACAPELLESNKQLCNMLKAAYMQLGMQTAGNKRYEAAQRLIAKATGATA